MAKQKKEITNETLIIRLPAELKIKLQEEADKDNRKLSDYVRLQLMKITGYTNPKSKK